MANFNYEIIGLIAAAITTFAWVPQVYKMYSEKNAAGVSLTMALLFFVGRFFKYFFDDLYEFILSIEKTYKIVYIFLWTYKNQLPHV